MRQPHGVTIRGNQKLTMTDIGPVYVIQYFGDLLRRWDNDQDDYMQVSPIPAPVFTTLDDALQWLVDEENFGQYAPNDEGNEYPITPDPEDDRIVIWEFTPGERGKVVWHFSGWHWVHDASDLPGGPLEQGILPGNSRSLYELAVDDY